MTKPWRVDVLECRGSSYDVGKQMAEGFLRTPRGRAFGRRRERRPFAFSLRNAQAALEAWAPNIWEELHGLANGLKISLERAVAEYSNARLRYPPRGCSAVMSDGLYGRNYDYDVGHYDRILVAIRPEGVNASIGFADRFTGRLDGLNEHGLCVGLHQVNNGAWQPGLACILIVRLVLDQCATTRDAIALLRRIPHGGGYNYSLMDAAGAAAVVEAAPAAVAVREGRQLGCSNHFLSPALQAYNRRNPGSWRHLPPLEAFARQQLPADRLFKALNDSLSPVFDHRYSSGSGTLHTIVCTPAARQMLIGVGGDAQASGFDLKAWVAGVPLGAAVLEGQLGGTAKPFDPGRRVIAKPGKAGPSKVFIGTPLDQALFKDLTLAKATFANVSLAGAKFDDIDFRDTVISSNCNFAGMQIAGVGVKELFAAYEQRKR
ncbi:MAG TPA: C45 family peptidase [Reyranella sp.]|jgi:predicted choloylglycine hydrolase|nr:C45 family peptidase [Reyranella sp.]